MVSDGSPQPLGVPRESAIAFRRGDQSPTMKAFVRQNTVAVAAVLSVVSLALVFGAVLQVGATALPHAPAAFLAAIPHVNAAISLTAIATIVAGVRAIRAGDVDRHRVLMVVSFVLFAVFLVLYLYRVTVEGPTPFDGPPLVETVVYYPVLAVHVSLAIVCLPLLFYVLSLAYAHPVSAIPGTNHRRIGRIAAALWLVSFSLGIVVYLLLYVVFP